MVEERNMCKEAQNMELWLIAAALPLGDDTPIALYAVLGIIALALVVASVMMSKKSKQNDSKDKNDQK